MSNWKSKNFNSLVKVLISIKNETEMARFLRDLCTIEELKELSGRWEVAKFIVAGIPYREIAEKTGVSTTTVTRVAYWIKHGTGGYKAVLGEK